MLNYAGRLSAIQEQSLLEDSSDAALARKAAAGDQHAWSLIYQAHHAHVYRYVRARVSEEEAADLTADVFVAAVHSIGRYAGERPLLAWLFGIARHYVADHHRKRKRRESF